MLDTTHLSLLYNLNFSATGAKVINPILSISETNEKSNNNQTNKEQQQQTYDSALKCHYEYELPAFVLDKLQ